MIIKGIQGILYAEGNTVYCQSPEMNYIAVRGSGNPNDEDGEYKQAIGLLYGIAFTIKMSKRKIIRLMDISIMSCRH